MRLAKIFVWTLAAVSLSALADGRRHDEQRRFERPQPAELRSLRDERRSRDEVDGQDYRRRERMSDDERRRLREDVDAASRDIYRRQR